MNHLIQQGSLTGKLKGVTSKGNYNGVEGLWGWGGGDFTVCNYVIIIIIIIIIYAYC